MNKVGKLLAVLGVGVGVGATAMNAVEQHAVAQPAPGGGPTADPVGVVYSPNGKLKAYPQIMNDPVKGLLSALMVGPTDGSAPPQAFTPISIAGGKQGWRNLSFSAGGPQGSDRLTAMAESADGKTQVDSLSLKNDDTYGKARFVAYGNSYGMIEGGQNAGQVAVSSQTPAGEIVKAVDPRDRKVYQQLPAPQFGTWLASTGGHFSPVSTPSATSSPGYTQTQSTTISGPRPASPAPRGY